MITSQGIEKYDSHFAAATSVLLLDSSLIFRWSRGFKLHPSGSSAARMGFSQLNPPLTFVPPTDLGLLAETNPIHHDTSHC
jgi:hypothetical protein